MKKKDTGKGLEKEFGTERRFRLKEKAEKEGYRYRQRIEKKAGKELEKGFGT